MFCELKITCLFFFVGCATPEHATNDPDMEGAVLSPTQAAVAGRNGLGWFVQAGYLIPRQPVEFAARYSVVRGVGDQDDGSQEDHSTLTSLSDADEVGGGVSWYPGGHPLKLQADYFRHWGDDIRTGADLVRIQLQVAF